MREELNVEELFASKVFTLGKMKERLPKSTYKEVKKIMDQGGELSLATADVVASAMKDWAIEHGATHFTHWFQPLTGVTAEKHVSLPEAYVLPLRQEVTLHGTSLPPHLSKRPLPVRPFVSLQHSVLIKAKHWIRRHRYFVPWRL